MKTVSGAYFRSVVDGCIANGVDAEALYAMIDGGETALDNLGRRFPSDMLITALNTAVSLTGDQSLGVKLGSIQRPTALSDTGHALTVCDDLAEVVRTNHIYQPLIQQIGRTHLELSPDYACMVWAPKYEEVELYRYFVEMMFAGYAVLGRWLLFSHVEQPVTKMEFRHKPPQNKDAANQLFGVDVIYGADVDQMAFRPELAHEPLPSRNPEMKRILLARLDKQLEALGEPQNFSVQALHLIHSLLPKGRPNINKLSKLMNISERSLRRKLAGEDKNFRSLLEQARKEACQTYLRQKTLTHSQIAHALGYSDQSAYGRAFKSWYGVSPNDYKVDIAKT